MISLTRCGKGSSQTPCVLRELWYVGLVHENTVGGGNLIRFKIQYRVKLPNKNTLCTRPRCRILGVVLARCTDAGRT